MAVTDVKVETGPSKDEISDTPSSSEHKVETIQDSQKKNEEETTHYVEGYKLFLVMIGLCLSTFLVALVRPVISAY